MPQHRNLRAIELGDPGHRGRAKLAGKLAAAKVRPAEPDWGVLFPGADDVQVRLLDTCRQEWEAVTSLLHAMGLLAGPLDVEALKEYCVCVARIDQCERQISEEGLTVMGRQGMIRNPCATIATQYRTQLARLIPHLGLSPNARDGMKQPEGDRGSDPFSA